MYKIEKSNEKFEDLKIRENGKSCTGTAQKEHQDKNLQSGYDSDDSRISCWSDEE